MSTSRLNKLLVIVVTGLVILFAVWFSQRKPTDSFGRSTPTLSRSLKHVGSQELFSLDNYTPDDSEQTPKDVKAQVESYVKQESDNPDVYHKVHVFKNELQAEEWVFDRDTSKTLFKEQIVVHHVPSSINWQTSKLKLLNNDLTFLDVPLFEATTSTSTLNLYESEGIARLVIVKKGGLLSMRELAQDAELPSKDVQDALKFTELLLAPATPKESNP